MILMGTNPLLGPLEGVGPENLNFFRAQTALALGSLPFRGPKSCPKIVLHARRGATLISCSEGRSGQKF
jgi:hypothetical protein